MDTLAARLREAFLGTETGEAVPFDELKDAVKDRWQRVADAAREVPPEGIALAAARERGRRAALRVPSVEELATIGHEANTNFVVHEDAATAIRDAVLAGLPTGEHAPIRVPFTDAQIERMAKAAREVLLGPCDADANWPMWYRAIRAALAAGGLEPCAVPEYDPADVALHPSDDEVEKLARVLCRWDAHDAPHEDSWTTTLLLDQNAYRHMARAAIAHLRPTQGHVLRDGYIEGQRKIENQRKELNRLNALIADLRAEVDEDNAAAASVNDLLVQVQNLTAERDAQEIELADLRFYQREFAAVSAERDELRERASVPVKVRWDVSDERLQTAVELGTFIRLDLDKIAHLRDVFAAHAVIDAPAGVPSVEELDSIAKQVFDANEGPYAAATAIRDAVLAGVAGERESLVNALVEAKRQRDELACKLIAKNPSEPVYGGWHFEDGYKIVPNVQSFNNIVDPPADQVEALARVFRDEHAKVMGTDALSYGLTVFCAYARAAIAHLAKRPEGLPTAEELLDRWAEFSVSEDTKEQFYLAALRPWLRDPVGWELDVGPIAMLKAFNAAPKGGVHRNVDDVEGMKAVLDLCRARIKPVYECKECAGLRDEVAFWKRENVASNNKMLAARAALEGE